MLKKRLTLLFTITLVCAFLASGLNCPKVSAWSNGGYSADPAHPDYGTHDWIAQHALDWLPSEEKQFFTDNLASYLYGTELPDNNQASDGVGDTGKHHVYFYANGSLQDASAADRARDEYVNAEHFFSVGNLSEAAKHLGMVAHYVADMAVFGHVMGAATAWGTEAHHSDYETYVQDKTQSYTSEFSSFLVFDGNLSLTSAYDAAVALARDSTFDGNGGLTCVWMDQHYNWSDATFKNRCGESLNLAVNAVADVLHTFYAETVIPELPFWTAILLITTPTLLIVTIFRRRKTVQRI